MKKLALFASILAIAVSCTVNEIDSTKGITAPEITASLEDKGTKTTLTTDDEGVGTIWWTPADEINVFYGKTSTHYTSKNTENATTVVFGTTDVIGSTEQAENNIWGLYPYDESAVCDGSSVTTTIPSSQKAVEGSFDDDLFTSLAHSTNTTMTFYNVCGGIKFSLSRDDIQTITFKGNNNEDIAGKVCLSMDSNDYPVADVTSGEKTITLTPKEGATFAKNTNYYIVMLPTVLSKGFTMTFETSSQIGIFNYTAKSVEIKRSIFGKKTDIDSYAEFKDNAVKALCFKAYEEQTIQLINRGGNTPNLQYSYDGTDWTDWDYSSLTFGTEERQCVYIRGNNENGISSSSTKYSQFRFGEAANVYCSGNVMNLLSYSEDLSTVPPYGFYYLFIGCDKLISAPELPATTIGNDGYSYMFYGCKSLTDIPSELPAQNIGSRCYSEMFCICSSLKTAPKILATTLSEYCCGDMFRGCTSLETVPDLCATQLAYGCYSNMFDSCKSLQTAPKLPATTLADWCYNEMFINCSSLSKAPELSATTLTENCYTSMFGYCISLTEAPKLPATSLASMCYAGMFAESGITSAPELPATTLATYCYFNMFWGCKQLNQAPELKALNLVEGCYCNMFHECSNLKYIKADFTTTPSSSYTENWVDGVSNTGIFIKNPSATWDVIGLNGIPEGWSVMSLVDLGLSVKWATCNIGASSPEEYGGYYQWAGITDVSNTSIYLDWNNCMYHTGSNGSYGWTKYVPSRCSSYWSGTGDPDNKTVLDPEDDIAHVILGGCWRMPTYDEFNELLENCEREWTIYNDVEGYKLSSKKNGNSIFLPAAGYRGGGALISAGTYGYYWSSSLNTYDQRSAYSLYLRLDDIFMNPESRYGGRTIRPVYEAEGK